MVGKFENYSFYKYEAASVVKQVIHAHKQAVKTVKKACKKTFTAENKQENKQGPALLKARFSALFFIQKQRNKHANKTNQLA